ncbi:MAG TPA: LysR family transcriptional regulator [Bosea sp. (in: a-proteobacteria)]|jgi:DNA-binding transcriptional LysR family regulator|uniref:LysR family transcriptional regulator n=1 Tax=Bosea sp. (in: a-proteobacteria) TaxID=1871050 RepID=UPI002E0EA3D3|nr:LysR family transcriptional regulator [Bosea sp. (in: a-proteobacteria)]
MDQGALSLFMAVARHLSFRRAAAEIGCTPSAVSHGLRALEERLQVRLVNRTTRSVALTEAGQRLYGRIGPAFRDITDALDDLNNYRDQPIGNLRLNAAHLATEILLLPYVTRFLERHPTVTIEIVSDNALIDMVSEGFDAGLRFGETVAQDMIAVPIGPRQRSAVVATPDVFARHGMPAAPEQLRDLPCLRLRFGSGRFYDWEFERGGIEFKVAVQGPLVLSDQGHLLQAALAGSGIAYLFESQVEQHIAEGRLVRVLEEWCPYYPGFHLYYPSRRQMPATLRAFIDFVRGERVLS